MRNCAEAEEAVLDSRLVPGIGAICVVGRWSIASDSSSGRE